MHEPIIDPETFEKVQAILQKRFRVRRHEFDNWLQGKVFCESCKQPMSLQIKDYKDTKTVIFRCIYGYKHPTECSGYRSIHYNQLYQMVVNQIVASLPEGEALPNPLSKSYIQKHVDRIFIGKRQSGGHQDVQIELTKPISGKRRKEHLPWFLNY